MRYDILLLIGLIITGGLVQAADEPVKATGDKIWGDDKNKISFIEGHVRIVQGSTIITTEKARVDIDKKIATFDERVKLTNKDVTIEADCLEFNFKKKQGNFSNNVILQQKETKDETGKVTKDAFKITSDNLYFESDTKNFRVENQGTVEHKEFTGTADTIFYNDKKQELLLEGNTILNRPNGEVIKGSSITINTQTNSFKADNQVNLQKEDLLITAECLHYDYKKKNGTFEKDVHLNRNETKDARGKVTKDPFALTTNVLFFESETKNFFTKGAGIVEHKDFTGTANKITYSDQKQEMEFTDNAVLKRPKNEEIRGEKITIFIKDKSFRVFNQVAIDFKVESDEDKK